MKTLTGWIGLGLLAGFPGFAQASDAAFERLAVARKLSCQFGQGSSANWKSGKPVLERGGFKAGTVRIEDIDSKYSRARVITGKEAGNEAKVVLSGGGLSVIEQTGAGTLIIITVYASSPREDEFIAVMSRHTELTDSPAPGQFHGVCQIV